jgi:hypothetical protein
MTVGALPILPPQINSRRMLQTHSPIATFEQQQPQQQQPSHPFSNEAGAPATQPITKSPKLNEDSSQETNSMGDQPAFEAFFPQSGKFHPRY